MKYRSRKRKAVGRSHRGFARKSYNKAYKQFIRSPEWQAIRAAKIASVNGCCEDCPVGDQKPATQVHHLNYTRLGGGELLTDLRALCKDHHEAFHRVAFQLGGMWFSSRVAAQHAMTQFGVDIRDKIIESYNH